MACEQQLKKSQGTSMLPNVVTTEQQSLIVVKKLLAIAVSCITYLRGLFPEKAYGSKYVEEQKVMILREERSCPGASQIVQCFQCSPQYLPRSGGSPSARATKEGSSRQGDLWRRNRDDLVTLKFNRDIFVLGRTDHTSETIYTIDCEGMNFCLSLGNDA
ncbi:hypothetical protein GJAV_G00008700 [Gymnothorax javanicus]|nr:hypothetical protein GJAV_G00008700 [Gymnothorax javanicus]